MREIASPEELKSLVGTEIGISDWLLIDQRRIDRFADATGDHQWIHVDTERCRTQSPFGCTIAHGFLTLSLVPALMDQVVALPGARMNVNYGTGKVRFPSPVPAGSRIRAIVRLQSADDADTGTKLVWHVTMERDGSDKPACVAEVITCCYW